MKEILPEVERWREAGEKVVVATVVATRRSAPRPVGTSLAVSESGKMCGSVSGGCVESDVYENAMEVHGDGRAEAPPLRDHRRHGVGGRPALRRRDRRLRGARRVRLVHRLRELRASRVVAACCSPSSRVTASAARRSSSRTARRSATACRRRRSRSSTSSSAAGATACSSVDGARVFAEWYGPPPRLLVYGAVDTAEALCRGAKLLGWTAIVADARATFLTPERMPVGRPADPEVAAGGDRRRRARPPDGDRRPHPRRQVRRAGADRRARDGGVLHRCARLAPQPGAAPRAAARGGRRGGAAGADRRARAVSTSAPTRRRRRRSRSSPRSSPSAPTGRAARCARRSSGSTSRSPDGGLDLPGQKTGVCGAPGLVPCGFRCP